MKYGLIGEHLGHSFSKTIHAQLADYEYEICEVSREEIDRFFERAEFTAINVTIPYKETVIPHLYEIDEHARMIGAVNTVVNRGGRLYGYNTDFYGMVSLAKHAGVDIQGKTVAILGTGGTSKTARAVAMAMGAKEVLTVSRRSTDGAITYDELYSAHCDTEVIINTTPVGMYPNAGVCAVDIAHFPMLTGVLDAVYNPLDTKLITDAKQRGIAAEGGLYMLVAQAVRASEIFLDTCYDTGITDRIYEAVRREKENIVLIGMPASGKSSVGRMIADKLGRKLIDTDELVTESAGITIPEIFATRGEAAFRDMETEAVKRASELTGAVIATGGGAVLRRENIDMLRGNGRLYFIDRPLPLLVPTSDRPLSSDRAAIEKRYKERYPIYTTVCDAHIDGSGSVSDVAERIIKEFMK